MKKFLLLVALTAAAAPAMASKARLSALSGSRQLRDDQTIFDRPSDLVNLGNWATVELGKTAPVDAAGYANGTVATAEGGFSHAMGAGYLGFYLGHHNDVVTSSRLFGSTGFATAANLLSEENPIDLYYAAKMGDLTWGAGLWYSNSNKKATSLKQSSIGVRGGVEMGNFDAYLNVGLVNTAESATEKYKGGTPIKLGVGYFMDTMYFYGEGTVVQAKDEVAAGTTKREGSSYSLGFVNTLKVDGGNFFYGVSYDVFNQGKDESAPAASQALAYQKLPFWIGIEADANSWLTIRGSVKQNVVLGYQQIGSNDSNTIANDTTASAGVGVKFNKLVLDATVSKTVGATTNTAPNDSTGDINGNNLLSNVALTYLF